MSDLSMYELEDIVWDDFGQTDDHIVPHDTHPNDQSFQIENRKRPRNYVNRVSKMPGQQKEERDSTTQNKKRNTMLEKDPWSHIAADSLCDKMPGQRFESVNTDSIGDGELCAGDSILGDIPQEQNDLSFLDNDQDEKESNDLLYYGWPDIENFEDVDRMFRSCDTSFGLGGAGNEDELGWFSSSDAIEGSENALKSELKFSSPESNEFKTGSQEVSNVTNESSSITDSTTRRTALASCNASSRPLVVDQPVTFSHVSFPHQVSETKDNFMPNEKLGMHKKQQKHKDESRQVFTSATVHPRQQNVGPDSFSYRQTNAPYMHLDYSRTTGVKSENNTYASNPINLVGQGPISDPVSVIKEIHQYGNGLKTSSKVERVVDLGILGELGSSNVQESSSMNSKFDEISLEATSFHQLKHVVEQLDLKTKLCIRDSLYRLAKSAEQRHNFANLNGDDRDSSGTLIADGTKKCAGFMDMETDTNPIDRTVAHLLFHRAPDKSASSLKSHVMIHGPIADQPMIVEKIVGHEESLAKTERRDN